MPLALVDSLSPLGRRESEGQNKDSNSPCTLILSPIGEGKVRAKVKSSECLIDRDLEIWYKNSNALLAQLVEQRFRKPKRGKKKGRKKIDGNPKST